MLQPTKLQQKRHVFVTRSDHPASTTPVVDRQAEQRLCCAAVGRAPTHEVQGIIESLERLLPDLLVRAVNEEAKAVFDHGQDDRARRWAIRAFRSVSIWSPVRDGAFPSLCGKRTCLHFACKSGFVETDPDGVIYEDLDLHRGPDDRFMSPSIGVLRSDPLRPRRQYDQIEPMWDIGHFSAVARPRPTAKLKWESAAW